MCRLIFLLVAALALAGCAGAYVAGDVGADHGNLNRLRALSSPSPPAP